MSKVKQLVSATQINELMSYGALSFEDFRAMMENICQGRLSDQEIITVARSVLSSNEVDLLRYSTLVSTF